MVQYQCDRCGKQFTQKIDHTRHLNRQRPCKLRDPDPDPSPRPPVNDPDPDLASSTPISTDASPNLIKIGVTGSRLPRRKKHRCKSCNSVFARSDSLNRHLNGRCKILKQKDMEKESIYQILLSKCEALEKRVHQMESVAHTTTHHTTTNNNITNHVQVAQLNQQVNIKVLAFQKEDLSHIGDDLYPEILKRGFGSVESLVRYVHFDKNKPENHNIYISNMRDQYAIVFDGEDWRLEKRDDVLQKLIDDKSSILSSKFDELINRLDEPTIRKFRRVLDEIDVDHVANKMKKELRLLLYNSRRIPEHTRELLGLAPPSAEGIELDADPAVDTHDDPAL